MVLGRISGERFRFILGIIFFFLSITNIPLTGSVENISPLKSSEHQLNSFDSFIAAQIIVPSNKVEQRISGDGKLVQYYKKSNETKVVLIKDIISKLDRKLSLTQKQYPFLTVHFSTST